MVMMTILDFNTNSNLTPVTYDYDGRLETSITATGYTEQMYNGVFYFRRLQIKFYTIEKSVNMDKIGYLSGATLDELKKIKQTNESKSDYFYDQFANDYVYATIFCSSEFFNKLIEFSKCIDKNRNIDPYDVFMSCNPIMYHKNSEYNFFNRNLLDFFCKKRNPYQIHRAREHYEPTQYIEKFNSSKPFA